MTEVRETEVPTTIVLSVATRGHVAECRSYQQAEVTLGRETFNDVTLVGDNVSKRHARVVMRDGKYILVDLKSTNGTFVNGKRISAPQVLKESDKVSIGDYTLMVGDDAAASAEGGAVAEKLEWVITLDGPSGRQQFALLDDVTVGRSSSSDIQINHKNVGRRQMRVLPFSRYVAVTDLGTTLGTWVNGERLLGSTRLSSSNDVIEFAGHCMWVHRPGEQPPTSAGRPGMQRGPSFKLVVHGLSGPELIGLEEGTPVIAGSDLDSRIVLPRGDIPPQMLQFRVVGEELFATELTATPRGVEVRGERLLTGVLTPLQPGDVLRLPSRVSISVQATRPKAPAPYRREVTVPRMRVPRPRPPTGQLNSERKRPDS